MTDQNVLTCSRTKELAISAADEYIDDLWFALHHSEEDDRLEC